MALKMVDWKFKPPDLCKNNPKLHLRRPIVLFLHALDWCGFFNQPFLKSLDYHKKWLKKTWNSLRILFWQNSNETSAQLLKKSSLHFILLHSIYGIFQIFWPEFCQKSIWQLNYSGNSLRIVVEIILKLATGFT